MAVWISACGTPVELLPSDASLRELYRDATIGKAAPLPMPALPSMSSEHWRDLEGFLRRDFLALPNPRLVLYVHPHLSATGDPIPGYATWFTVFERALIYEKK